MRNNLIAFLIHFLLVIGIISCTTRFENVADKPILSPDYVEVTIPRNIAPIRFHMSSGDRIVETIYSAGEINISCKGKIRISDWKKLCESSDSIQITLKVIGDGKRISYNPFSIYLSDDVIDSHIAYRLIEPGYVTWNEMGIYCRDLGTYEQRTIVENSTLDRNCMNCHSFCNRNHEKLLFHMRAKHGGTYLFNDSILEKLNTKTDSTISALVYPYWHPDGKHIAFSVNDIMQSFHSTKLNRVEVFDGASDIVVYNIEKDEIFSTPFLKRDDVLETFPSFSPDGKSLYYCSSKQQVVPQDYDKIKYSVCRVSFDPLTDSFGRDVDTLYSASVNGKSAVLPRVSPDGRFLLLSESEYGCFHIWHKDANLFMIDLRTGERLDIDASNSEDAESYHSWSSNSRWIVYTSRRDDGLYTRPYFCHIDSLGNASKPFALPQVEGDYYDRFLKSYNIPEFVDGFPELSKDIIDSAVKSSGKNLKYRP